MNYTIGEIAKLLKIAPSTIRYYEKEELLPFTKRTESGIRIFDESDYEYLKVIECLKSAGMQIKDIREFNHLVKSGDESIQERQDLFEKQKKAVEDQLRELKTTLDFVNYKCWYYKKAKELGSTNAVEVLDDEALPPELVRVRNYLKNKL